MFSFYTAVYGGYPRAGVGGFTGVWIFCEAETFGPPRFGVIDKAKVLNIAGAAEDVCDLFLGQACVEVLRQQSDEADDKLREGRVPPQDCIGVP